MKYDVMWPVIVTEMLNRQREREPYIWPSLKTYANSSRQKGISSFSPRGINDTDLIHHFHIFDALSASSVIFHLLPVVVKREKEPPFANGEKNRMFPRNKSERLPSSLSFAQLEEYDRSSLFVYSLSSIGSRYRRLCTRIAEPHTQAYWRFTNTESRREGRRERRAKIDRSIFFPRTWKHEDQKVGMSWEHVSSTFQQNSTSPREFFRWELSCCFMGWFEKRHALYRGEYRNIRVRWEQFPRNA